MIHIGTVRENTGNLIPAEIKTENCRKILVQIAQDIRKEIQRSKKVCIRI